MDIVPEVPHLTRADFSPCGSLKNYKSGVAVVMFCTPSSRFCQSFSQEYLSLYKMCSANNKCQIFVVNMEQGTNNALISMSSKFPYDIANFPTIVIYYNGDPCSVYLEERTASSLFSKIQSMTDKGQCKFKFVPCE
jgi:hypothetical protein